MLKWPKTIISAFHKNENIYYSDDNKKLGETIIFENRERISVIFMHIHKCAGTSLIQALEQHENAFSVVGRPGNFKLRSGPERVPGEIWNSAFKFSVVRNPFDRVVSAYKMFSMSPRWANIFPGFDSFVEFLRWSDVHNHFVESDGYEGDGFVNEISNIIHHCSSYDNQKYKLDEMDHIAHLETLADDMEPVQRHLTRPLKLPRLRKGEDKHYREFYTPRLRRIIEELYASDIARFSYQF